jgi:hypothetical protein
MSSVINGVLQTADALGGHGTAIRRGFSEVESVESQADTVFGWRERFALRALADKTIPNKEVRRGGNQDSTGRSRRPRLRRLGSYGAGG